MEEAWISLYLHNWSCYFLCCRVIGIETVSLLVGTAEYEQVSVFANSDALWVGNLHSFDSTHCLLFQINYNRYIGKAYIRIFKTL